jgi:hypothetical protein
MARDSPGGFEGGEGADNAEGNQLMERDVPGGSEGGEGADNAESNQLMARDSPGGSEGSEGADNAEGNQLMARNVEGPGGEAAVCGGPHSQLTASLVVQDLSRPLLPHWLHTQ